MFTGANPPRARLRHAGTYTVTLTESNPGNAAVTFTRDIVVNPVPPTVAINAPGPASPLPESPATFSATVTGGVGPVHLRLDVPGRHTGDFDERDARA